MFTMLNAPPHGGVSNKILLRSHIQGDDLCSSKVYFFGHIFTFNKLVTH